MRHVDGILDLFTAVIKSKALMPIILSLFAGGGWMYSPVEKFDEYLSDRVDNLAYAIAVHGHDTTHAHKKTAPINLDHTHPLHLSKHHN